MAQSTSKTTGSNGHGNRRTIEMDLGAENTALTSEADPTREIRSLIEQLQNTSRDAKARQRQAEEERDAFERQLHNIRTEVETAKQIEHQLQSVLGERDKLVEQSGKFGEVVAEMKHKLELAERARDEVMRSREEVLRAHREVSKKLDEAAKTRDEATRQRDEAFKSRDALAVQRENFRKERDALATQAAQLPETKKAATAAQTEAAELRTQISALQKQASENSKAGTDAVKQLAALRQARDAGAAQVTELKSKLSAAEDQIAEISYERDAARKAAEGLDAAKKAAAELSDKLAAAEAKAESHETTLGEVRAELETARSVISNTREELENMTAEREKASANSARLSQEITDLRSSVERINTEHDAEVSEIRGEIEKITTARETELAEAESKLAKLRTSHESDLAAARQQGEALATERDAAHNRISQLETNLADVCEQAKTASAERDAALVRTDDLQSELATARQQGESLAAERDTARSRAQQLETDLTAVRSDLLDSRTKLASSEETASASSAKISSLEESLKAALARAEAGETSRKEADASRRENKELQKSLEVARTALGAAQKQIEMVAQDREEVRAKGLEKIRELEKAIKMQEEEVARSLADCREMEQRCAEHERIASHFEKQRLDMIELTAQLENAQREIKELGANFAEARLAAKNAERRASQATAARTASAPTAPAPAFSNIPVESSSRKQAKTIERLSSLSVGDMRTAFQNFTRRPGEVDLMRVLFQKVQVFADECRASGQRTLTMLANPFARLVSELHAMPEQVTPAMLRTVSHTIEFLGNLCKESELDQMARLSDAKVYIVDDDHSAGDAVVSALAAVGLGAKATQAPVVAVSDLAGSRMDLIILDVELPELDGFELCSHIRHMALHSSTPIVFLTGHPTLENRVQSSLRGGDEFMSKPFNLHELGLKALMLILRSQLRMA